MSAKKRAEIEARKLIVRDVCELAGYSVCSGPIEKHEIVRRSQSSTAATDERLVIGLCTVHHRLDTFKDEAVELGIRIDPDEWRLCGGDPDLEAGLVAFADAKRAVARGEETAWRHRFVEWCDERGYDPVLKAAEFNLALCSSGEVVDGAGSAGDLSPDTPGDTA